MAPGKYDYTAIDRQPFYGHKLPPNIIALKKIANRLDRGMFQRLVRMAVSQMEGKSLPPQLFISLVTKGIPLETVNIAYSGILRLIQLAYRWNPNSLTKEQFVSDISFLNLSKEMVEDLTSAVYGSRRAVVEDVLAKSKPRLPTVSEMKWKIDVTISTASLNRVLEPSISVQMTLDNGDVKHFEMTVERFQELRYSAANALREMEELEKKSILKIQD